MNEHTRTEEVGGITGAFGEADSRGIFHAGMEFPPKVPYGERFPGKVPRNGRVKRGI